jgi:hypothetical protein
MSTNEQPQTPVQLCESAGLSGEALIRGVMEVTSCSRAEAVRQISWAHGDHFGDHRIVEPSS